MSHVLPPSLFAVSYWLFIHCHRLDCFTSCGMPFPIRIRTCTLSVTPLQLSISSRCFCPVFARSFVLLPVFPAFWNWISAFYQCVSQFPFPLSVLAAVCFPAPCLNKLCGPRVSPNCQEFCTGFKYYSVVYQTCLVHLSLQGGAEGQGWHFWDPCFNTPGRNTKKYFNSILFQPRSVNDLKWQCWMLVLLLEGNYSLYDLCTKLFVFVGIQCIKLSLFCRKGWRPRRPRCCPGLQIPYISIWLSNCGMCWNKSEPRWLYLATYRT